MDAQALADLQESSFERAGHATRSSYPPENRMSGEVILSFIEARHYIVVATTRPNGKPHIAPSGYLLYEGALWLPTTEGAARLRNVASAAHASLALTEGEGDFHAAVLMEGPASVVAADGAPGALMQMWRDRFATDGGWIAHWVVVRPTKLFSYRAPGWRPPK